MWPTSPPWPVEWTKEEGCDRCVEVCKRNALVLWCCLMERATNLIRCVTVVSPEWGDLSWRSASGRFHVLPGFTFKTTTLNLPNQKHLDKDRKCGFLPSAPRLDLMFYAAWQPRCVQSHLAVMIISSGSADTACILISLSGSAFLFNICCSFHVAFLFHTSLFIYPSFCVCFRQQPGLFYMLMILFYFIFQSVGASVCHVGLVLYTPALHSNVRTVDNSVFNLQTCHCHSCFKENKAVTVHHSFDVLLFFSLY